MNKPLVSIITISFNSEATISKTIESIINQSYGNIEYIIVDGNSSDKTIEIVEEYKEKIIGSGILFKFLSEKDSGIADAWNKGLNLVSGSIVGMLNSDDYYEKNSISKVVGCMNPTLEQVSYGVCNQINEKDEVVHVLNGKFNKNRVYLNFGFSHTTCFVTRKVFETVGDFNLSYKIGLDTEFLLRCLKANIEFIKCNNVTYMRLGGISTKFRKKALFEYQRSLKESKYNLILIWIFGLLKRALLLLK